MTHEHWRPGRKVGRTLYVHVNGAETGHLIGLVDTPELATKICDAVNAANARLSVEEAPADERP
ncbi:hypothetical protein OHR68_43105 [Spirillospora sp. NBC_00431]